jgi:hypothetical protein
VKYMLMEKIWIVKTNVEAALISLWAIVEKFVTETYVWIMDALHAMEYQKTCLWKI